MASVAGVMRVTGSREFVMLEKGLDAASMDDVAARAGTTRPTVYAHFKSKDEQFSAVVELIKGLFLGERRSPDVYAAEPVEKADPTNLGPEATPEDTSASSDRRRQRKATPRAERLRR